jgi:carbon storage regulator
MLILTRHRDERIEIGDDITITILDITSRRVRIGIDAPPGVPVNRSEIAERMRENGGVTSLAEGSEQ